MVKVGLERLLSQGCELIKGKRVGLITNHTGVDGQLRSNIDLLHNHPDYKLVALYGPEHGVRGNAAAGEHVESYTDERTGLPVFSLYGATRKPSAEMLAGVEALIFDIADIGCRYYTFPYSMAYTMQAAAQQGIPYLVLDRPNPINGLAVEGNILEPEFSSFVGLYPVATRHGMTIGELAGLFNQEYRIGCQLEVIGMTDWHRQMWWDQTGLPWVMPSPNSPTFDMALVYPGTCLFEGTNISEGRGTTKPFQLIGAPWVNAEEWAEALNRLMLPGVLFRPAYFTPTSSKHQGVLCGGVELHVTHRQHFLPVRTGLEMLASVQQLHSDFAWIPPYNQKYFIDLLAGTNQLRLAVDAGKAVSEIMSSWQQPLTSFIELRKKYLLY